MKCAALPLICLILGTPPVAASGRITSLDPPGPLTTLGLAAGGGEREMAPPRLQGLTLPIPFNASVRGFVRDFEGPGKARFARGYARMGRYRALMLPLLEAQGLPPELLYVCLIESAFNVDAVSRAAAVGPWQFVRSTARHYGLRHDEWIDERRDPVKATRAAARLLSDLHRRFGSWPLALAAYNAGVGGVRAAIVRAGSDDFWTLVEMDALPTQAARYVPKIMAAILVGSDPARHGLGAVLPEPALDFRVIAVPGMTDLVALARAGHLPLSALSRLNPELRRGITPPDADYPLRVPAESFERVVGAVERTRTATPRVFAEHPVRFGESLRSIARRYGASRSELRRINRLLGEPEPGQVLLVPRPPPGRHEAPAAPDELWIVHESGLRFASAGRAEVFFPIRRPLKLEAIARFFGVTVGDLCMWNALDPKARLQRGMALRIFARADLDRGQVALVSADRVTAVAPGTEAASNALAHASRERPAHVRRVRYKVRPGDNLWKIARRYGTTVKAVRAENGMGRGALIGRGSTLQVPVAKRQRPRGKAARRRPKAEARGGGSYTVRPGDTLWKIARRYNLKLEALRRRNGLPSGPVTLQPGQRLRIR